MSKDVVHPADIARRPDGTFNSCNCNSDSSSASTDTQGYWIPAPPNGCCPPPPPLYPPYPYPPFDAPVSTQVGSIEAKIAKLSKKSATLRKMIENLIKKNKSVIISIGSVSYNFGTYLNKEGEETEYGEKILEILQSELAAVKEEIINLTNELEAVDETDGTIETTIKD